MAEGCLLRELAHLYEGGVAAGPDGAAAREPNHSGELECSHSLCKVAVKVPNSHYAARGHHTSRRRGPIGGLTRADAAVRS